jgi:serine/threonine protein kinase
LNELFPGTDNAGIEILKKMLRLNPNERITAEQAINDSDFDDIRLPE